MHPFNLSKFHFNYKIFSSSKEEAILDVAISSKLTFPSYIVYVKRQHYWVILDIRQYKLIFKSRIPVNVHYCPQVWMF